MLRDVAQAAGVSAMTVSRALRRPDRVAPATGRKIRKLAQKMGYQPDPHLVALAMYRQRLRRRSLANGTRARRFAECFPLLRLGSLIKFPQVYRMPLIRHFISP
jgi:hypothetical protein